jgi:hypothetical protein
MSFLDSLASGYQRISPIIDYVAQREQDNGYNAMMSANPEFAQQYYGGQRANEQQNMLRQQQEQEKQKRSALAQLAQQMQTGQIDQQSALQKYAGITGDFAGVFPSGQSTPAAVQTALAIQAARARGDNALADSIEASAKIYDKGVLIGDNGVAQPMAGYGSALGNLAMGKAAGAETGKLTVQGQMLPALEGAKVGAKMGAEAQMQGQIDLPKVEAQANETLNDINLLRNHKGLSAIIGAKNPLQGAIPFSEKVVEGSPAAGAKAILDKVKGGAFLQAVQNLKGTGQITEIEGEKAQAAVARLNQAQSEEDFMAALKDYEDIIRLGMSRAKQKAQPMGIPQVPASMIDEAALGGYAPANMPPREDLNQLQPMPQGRVIRFDAQGNMIQ